MNDSVAGGSNHVGTACGKSSELSPATGGVERLQFVLPSFPPSVNRLHRIDHVRRRVGTSDEVLLWRTRTTPFVKPCRWPNDWLLKLTLEYESPEWICKNGKLRRKDSHNLDKICIDLVFAKWGWDDSRVVELISRKCHGPHEQVRVTLEKSATALPEILWIGSEVSREDLANMVASRESRIRQLEKLSTTLAAEVDRQRPVIEAARVLSCSLRRHDPAGWSGTEEALERAVTTYEAGERK